MDIVFMGSPDFAVPSLEVLANSDNLNIKGVVSQPDRRKGRGQKKRPTPIKAKAEELGLNVFTTKDINASEFINKIKGLNPEAIVVVAFGQILKKPLLEMPQYGCINLHASLLPSYRGASPIHQAVINGDKKTGVTTMLMEEGLDTGDILYQKEINIDKKDTVGSIHDKLANKGSKLLLKTLIDLEKEEVSQRPQNECKASYTPIISKDLGKIDWNETAKNIYNLVRGVNPFPGAYTYLEGKLFKVWWVTIIDHTKVEGKPGEIVKASPEDGLIVQTGKGKIKLVEIQPSGRKKMPAKDFLRGNEITPGTILSSNS